MIKKATKRKKAKKSKASEPEPKIVSALAETLISLNEKPKKTTVTLYLDEELYKDAKEEFGKKISEICNSAIKDALAMRRAQKTQKKEEGD